MEPVEEKITEPWDRQPGEPSRWYVIFVKYYLTMGLARTVRGSYLRYLKEAEPDKYESEKAYSTPPKHWRDMAAKWSWKERAEAFDEWQTDLSMATVEEAARKLRLAAVDAVAALVLALGTMRYSVQAAKEILDRSGIPATVRQEMAGALNLTSDDLAKATEEVKKWENEHRSSTSSPKSG
jgi:prophage DNA circulation protein